MPDLDVEAGFTTENDSADEAAPAVDYSKHVASVSEITPVDYSKHVASVSEITPTDHLVVTHDGFTFRCRPEDIGTVLADHGYA